MDKIGRSEEGQILQSGLNIITLSGRYILSLIKSGHPETVRKEYSFPFTT